MLLRGLIGGLEVTWLFHPAKVLFVRLVLNHVLAKWCIRIFQGQRVTIEPENGLSPCQTLFCTQPPSAEARIAKAIEGTRDPRVA
jgi:hypothetical protein